MKYYLGIDIGTSGTKAVCFDVNGKPMMSADASYELMIPKAGYAEEDPNDWWNAVCSVIQKITKAGYVIEGIGLSGQMHGLCLLDHEDKLLRNSIIWCDNRAVEETAILERDLKCIQSFTGNPPVAAFTLAKLLWVKRNEPKLFKKISKIMLPKDYIRYRLTKEFKTEYSDASGMQLLDIYNKCYCKPILDYLEITEEMLPTLIESQDSSGVVLKEVAKDLGLPDHCIVAGGAGDQAAAAIGSGIIEKGDISIVLGSSGVVFSPILKEDLENNQLQVFMHAVPDTYHVMGVTNGCGLSYKWWCEEIAKEDYNKLNEDAEKVASGADGLVYLPYLNGERTPIMDPYASGTFIGIRQNTTKGHMTRAILEGVSYSLLDCFSLLPKANYRIRIGGGGAKSILWRKIIASMLHQDIERIEQQEGGALGVAILAMVANKEYQSILDACNHIIKTKDIVKPDEKWYQCYHQGFKQYKEAYASLKKYYKNAFQGGKEE